MWQIALKTEEESGAESRSDKLQKALAVGRGSGTGLSWGIGVLGREIASQYSFDTVQM